MESEQGFGPNQELNSENILCQPIESEKYERQTKELKRGHSKTVNNLTKIAQEAGFKKLFIRSRFDSGSIAVDPDIDREAVFFPEDGLENNELLEKIDSKFTKKGAKLTMLHEKQHLEGPADKFINNYVFKGIESQTNLQSINKNSKEFKDLIEAIATFNVYSDFIYEGIDSLEYEGGSEQFIYYDDYYNFLKPDIIDKAAEKENEIRKELLKKYNKLKKDKLKN